MNKIERVCATLNGADVDRPPFSFWYHFGLQHMPGEKVAEAEIDFFKAYDLDFLKVMSDYSYPLPDGLEVIETADDWKRLQSLEGTEPGWSEQLKALKLINQALKGEALFIETVFSPWTTARRLARATGVEKAQKEHPDILLEGMRVIAESLANYARRAIEMGASGIFYSVSGATNELMTEEEYSKWGRPFDLIILNAVKGAPFNVLHIHGSNIHFDSLLDYPVAALNWSHYHTQPTLADGRHRWGRAVMGGIDEVTTSRVAIPDIRRQVRETVEAVGKRGLIITPGCSVPTDTAYRTLNAIAESVKSLA